MQSEDEWGRMPCQLRLKHAYLCRSERFGRGVSNVVVGVTVHHLDIAVAHSLLVVVVTCTKVHITCCDKVLTANVIGLLIISVQPYTLVGLLQ